LCGMLLISGIKAPKSDRSSILSFLTPSTVSSKYSAKLTCVVHIYKEGSPLLEKKRCCWVL
jgi:hypothetical protein